MTKYLPLNDTLKHFENDENLKDLVRFNEMTCNIEYRRTPTFNSSKGEGDPLLDEDFILIRYYLGKAHDVEPNRAIVGEACYVSSRAYSYHPIKSYIKKTKWDGVHRLDTWLISSCNTEDNIYVREVGAKMLIAGVARVFNPGCKFDHMTILEGSQGIGKSTLIEIMAGEWYLDTNFMHRDKDLIESLRGAWYIEIGEMTGFNKKDITWIKQFLSRKVDRVRLPYDRASRDLPRQCVFVGTLNPSGDNMYLGDDTGNRRFWPIECRGSVNFAWIKENRDQLWAEAYTRYKEGEKLYIDNANALEIMLDSHKDREVESPMLRVIRNYLVGKKYISIDDIMTNALSMDIKRTNYKELMGTTTVIGINMRKLGWFKGNNVERHMYFAPGYSLTQYRIDKQTQNEVEWDES